MKTRSASPADASIFLARPLLECSKAELQAFAATENISFSNDATNASVEILRNRIRHKLLPLLRSEFQPALETTVLRAMDLFGAENEVVRQLATQWRRKKKTPWNALPLAVQRQILRSQLFEWGAPVDFDRVESLRKDPSRPIAIDRGKYARHDGAGQLLLESRPAGEFLTATKKIRLRSPGGSTTFDGLTITWEIAEAAGAAFSIALNTEQFDADSVGESIILRHWQPGDRFRLVGSDGARKLQDVFTDLKTPKEERRRCVVAATANGEVFWVQGLRIGDLCKLQPRTQRRLVWRWREM